MKLSDPNFVPANFAVFVVSAGSGMRIGNARTLQEVAVIIAESKKARRNTFGGLIAPDNSPVKYRVFEATGWWEVPTE